MTTAVPSRLAFLISLHRLDGKSGEQIRAMLVVPHWQLSRHLQMAERVASWRCVMDAIEATRPESEARIHEAN